MDYHAWDARRDELVKRGHHVGDLILSSKDGDAIVRRCQHTDKRYVCVSMNCLLNDPPHWLLVGFPQFRGPHLKAYLEDQAWDQPIKCVEVVQVRPCSLVVRPYANIPARSGSKALSGKAG